MVDAEWICGRWRQHEEATAVVDWDDEWSFSTLSGVADSAAAAILDGRSDLDEARVAFLLPPGRSHVAVQWGIWRAGGVAVPLAFSHPERELAHVLDDAKPSLVVVDPANAGRLRPLASERGIRCITTDFPRRATAALPRVGLHRRALMIYTSGTTGRPKGVVSTHAGLSAQIRTLVDAWGWQPTDRALHVLPLHHVHGLVNVLCCGLWIGATCEFVRDPNPTTVWQRLASGSVTVFMAVPTIYARLIAAWEAEDARTRTGWSRGAASLRLMVSGSAALPVSILARWQEITGHRLLERYGMTEIGMALSNPLEGERRAGSVGQPLPGVAVRLVDDSGTEVPSGTVGEIEVRGPQVFLEYWQRADETRAAFNHGWFRTGDVAVVEDGRYRILGRKSSDIIKSGGYKISALEIEELMREHPGVRDCAVVGIPDPDLGERVAAAVESRPGWTVRETILVGWARERLAPYKVPRVIRFLDTLPRNAMGKVTKSVVRALFADAI